MTLTISSKLAETIVNSTVTQLGSGVAEPNTRLIVWSGQMPTTADMTVEASCKMLIDVMLPNPAFGAAAVIGNTVEALAFAVPQIESLDTGEASFFRLYDREGDVCIQGSVSDDPDAPAPLMLNQTMLYPGASVTIERLVVGIPLI